MTLFRQRLMWIAGAVILAAVTAYLVSKASPSPPSSAEDDRMTRDFHSWMHEQLELSHPQIERLEPLETDFEKAREELHEEITRSGQDLAAAVRLGDRNSPEISRALERLNHAQGKLQRITLDHFFEMKKHLDPEQSEKLLQWTHDSIIGQ